MKKRTQNSESAPPWEDTPEEPQRITATEASAAAAVRAGSPANRSTVRGNRESSPSGITETATGTKTTARSGAQSAAKPGALPAEKGAKSRRPRWQPSQMGYRWVVRNISFLLFLAALAVVYIYNGHYADKLSRDLNRTNKELKELQYEYKTLKSEVMFRSKQSELARAVEPFGLKELTRPPFVLIDSVQK
jgi:Bacteriodetes cell division protein (FtsL-like)